MGERGPKKEDVLKALYHTGRRGGRSVVRLAGEEAEQSGRGGGSLKMKEEVQGSNTKSSSVEV